MWKNCGYFTSWSSVVGGPARRAEQQMAEGVVADLSPEINVMNVVTARLSDQLFKDVDWRSEILKDAQAVYASAHKSLEIPSLLADAMRTGLKGEANFGIEHHTTPDLNKLVEDMLLKLCAALVAAALFICGGLLCNVEPLVGTLSYFSIACFALSVVLLGWAFWWKDRKSQK